MTRTPADPSPAGPDGEVLDELDDDAIVAQQSALHSPQPRVQVSMESRSVVIADDAELTPASRQSAPHQTTPIGKHAGKDDPTVMIRDKRMVAELAALEYPPPRPPRKRSTTTLVWLTAGLIAFGFGGVLALLARSRGDTAQSPPPTPPSAELQAAHASEEPKVTQKREPSEPTEPAAPETDDGQAVSASELPIESAKSGRSSAARPKSPVKAARPARAPAPKSDIPSGI